jgi:TP901 family phage tail tape measure protein
MAEQVARPKVILDDKEVKSKLDSLRAKSEEIRKTLQYAITFNADFTVVNDLKKQLGGVNNEMRQLQKQALDVNKVLSNLSGATKGDLVKAKQKLEASLSSTARGTAEWDVLIDKIKLVKTELQKVNSEMAVQTTAKKGFLSRANGAINEWGMLAMGAIASFTGLTLAVSKYSDKVRELEDRKLNLQSMTGLSGKEAQYFEEQANKLSTSKTKEGVRITSETQDIIDAYTLMGSKRPELLKSKEDLADVTEKALILSAASKESAQASTEAVAMAMNQFGAAANEASRYINVLAAGSQAGAVAVPMITESLAKMGPVATMVGMNVEQTVAMIETLGEKGIEGAEAGTQLRGMLLKLATGADEYNPKIVGMQKAFENLSKAQLGTKAMTKMFGDENITAAEILIKSVPKLKEYEKAVTGTNTAYEQAIINTSGAKATLAQARNEFTLNAMALAEKLEPAIRSVTVTGSSMLKLLMKLPEILIVMAPAIVGLTAAWITYNASVVTTTGSTKLLEFWNTKVIGGLQKVRTFLATNPATAWIAAIGALASVGIGLYQSFKNVNSIGAEFIKNMTSEKIALDNAFTALKQTKVGTDERRLAIKLINEKYGEYLPNLLTEKSSLKEIEAAQDAATKALIRNIAAKSKQTELEKIITDKSADIEKATKDLYNDAVAEKGQVAADIMMKKISNIADKYQGSYAKNYKKIAEELNAATRDFGRSAFFNARDIVFFRDQINSQTKDVETFYQKYLKMLGIKDKVEEVTPAPTPESDPKGDQPSVDQSKLDERLNKEKEALEKWFREKQNLYKQQYLQEKADKSMFDAEMYTLEITRLMRLKALENKYGKDISEIEGQLLDKRIDFREKANDMAVETQKEGDSFLIEVTKDANEGFEKLLEVHNKEMQEQREKDRKDEEKEEEENERLAEEKLKKDFEDKKSQYENFRSLSDDFAQSFGSLMGDFVTDQEMTQADFANSLLLIGLDTLHNVVRMAIAQIWAGAMASPESIASWGIAGAAKAAGMSVLVETAFAVAKATLRKPTAQREFGKYDVLGTDGNTYSAQVNANPGTGIYGTPTLFAEKGDELIVDGGTLRRIQMRSPWIIDQIMQHRVPQRAEGKYDAVANSTASVGSMDALLTLISKQNSVIERLNKRLDAPLEAKMLSSNARSVLEREDMIKGKAKRG